jgi:hypothetical protein
VITHTIPDTSMELLRLAVQKDNRFQSAVARNYAVIACLNVAQRLHEISVQDNKEQPAALMNLLKAEKVPANFIIFTGAVLRRITDRINEMMRQNNISTIPLVTDYDAHALKALGLTLSEVCWDKEGKDNFSGPTLDICFQRIAGNSLEQLWTAFTKHYIGNILQYYFDQADLRKDLELRHAIPADEEHQLRERDASSIAAIVMDEIHKTKKQADDVFDFAESMSATLQQLSNQS